MNSVIKMFGTLSYASKPIVALSKYKNLLTPCPRYLYYTQNDLNITKFKKELASEPKIKFDIQSSSVRTRLLRRPILNTANFISILAQLKTNSVDNNFLFCYIHSLIHKSYEDSQFPSSMLRSIGTRMMQYFHLHQLDHLALRFYNDDRLKFLFYMEFGCQIFFDLLYKKEQYTKIIDCYKDMHEKHIIPAKEVFHILIAACYQMNTIKMLDFASNAMENQPKSEIFLYTWNILILFALNMNDPHMAYSILRKGPGDQRRTRFNLTILTLARIRRLESIIPLLQAGVMNNIDGFFSEEILHEIRKTIELFGSKALLDEFDKIFQQIHDTRLVTAEALEQMTFANIKKIRLQLDEKDKMLIEFDNLKKA